MGNKRKNKKMTYLQAIALLAGSWGAYKMYEKSKKKGIVEFGELELVGVDVVDEKFITFDEVSNELSGLHLRSKNGAVYCLNRMIDKIKKSEIQVNHAAAILANVFIECGFDGNLIEEGYSKEQFNKMYSNRKDIGNTGGDDGYKFRGRGFCQLTGRELYEQFSKYHKVDAISNPDLALDWNLNFDYMFDAFIKKGSHARFNGYKLGTVMYYKKKPYNLMLGNSLAFHESRRILNFFETKKYQQIDYAGNILYNLLLKYS
ncbi:hypothetical protein ACT4R9_11370 [Ornithobacterium rhinotracheale]|uniref:hypothetical protein n=1 Tax=Ornithobacterium rhinotracheale TaxID=28251 RepID=UPI003FA41813